MSIENYFGVLMGFVISTLLVLFIILGLVCDNSNKINEINTTVLELQENYENKLEETVIVIRDTIILK